MKRKEYRVRQAVLLNVEKDRWTDFVDLCDRECKSASLKFSEMLEQELEKKAVGEQTPIKISYGKQENKPVEIQMLLTSWLQNIDTIQTQKELSQIVTWTHALNKQASHQSKKLYLKGIRQ